MFLTSNAEYEINIMFFQDFLHQRCKTLFPYPFVNFSDIFNSFEISVIASVILFSSLFLNDTVHVYLLNTSMIVSM